jgi:glycosyltransferase involved in cell wall biosynthesis
MTPTVHVVEPGGSGGVYQHAASLAAALAAEGVPVVFHTAAAAEEGPADAVPRHPCFWHFQGARPRTVRRAAVAAGWLGAGVPSCLARFRRGDIVHLEGWFRPPLLLPLVAGAKARGCLVALSPHTPFTRRGRPGDEWLMRRMARAADVVFAFSAPDRRRIEEWGVTAVQVPMVLDPPRPRADLIEGWRRRWEAEGAHHGRERSECTARKVVLFAGQVRPDKGLDLLVRAAAGWPDHLVLAVVGEDHGGLAEARRLAGDLGVALVLDDGYQPVEQFVAALAAADVVACPYRRSSQSAILVTAATLGRPTVVTDVGGLPELGMVVVPPDDPAALTAGIERALRAPGPTSRPPSWASVVPRYLDAYALIPLGAT